MMARIALVTDSTCDLPGELLQQYGVQVVPLNVTFGTENFLDGVTLSPEQFFQMLTTSPHHPSTSQPSPGDFAAVYERLTQEFDQILSVHLSAGLSGTYQSALMARDLFPQADITVLDTRSASIGLGWIVLLCARAIAAGQPLAEVVEIGQQAAAQQHILLTVESLEWLQKNGRIGKASALLGSLLNVRPLLHVDEGVVAAYDKVRGKVEKVMSRMVEAMEDFVSAEKPVYLGVVHAERPELAERLAQLVAERYQVKDQVITTVGAVIGVNTGPGTLGFVLVPAAN